MWQGQQQQQVASGKLSGFQHYQSKAALLTRPLHLSLPCLSTSLFPLTHSSFLSSLHLLLMHAFPFPFTTEEFMFYCSCCVPKMAAPNPLQSTLLSPSFPLLPPLLLLSIACRLPPSNAFIGTVISALPDYASRRITRRLSATQLSKVALIIKRFSRLTHEPLPLPFIHCLPCPLRYSQCI